MIHNRSHMIYYDFHLQIGEIMSEFHVKAAQLIRNAYKGVPISPLREYLEPTDAAGAYAVQHLNTDFWKSQGRKIVGRKAGLTAKAVQSQLGVSQPDFGVLFDDMQIKDGGFLNPTKVIQPKAEAEVAIILGSPLLSANTTPKDVAKATKSVHAAIEIVDSRIADWKITFADTVADNGSSAFFVISETGVPLDGLDLYTCGMAMEVNGEIASIGAGAACLGHPLNAAAWLASTLAANGDPLKAGDIILTGALGPMIAISEGQNVKAQIGGLGCVSFTYGTV